MAFELARLVAGGCTVAIDQLAQLELPPEPFAPGTTPFWDDPHISQQMLAAHLDPALAAASRPHAEIDCSVEWIAHQLGLGPGAALLDLGCGPGLYAERFAARGLRVTGVDYSRRSIDHATQSARARRLAIDYRCQNYLELDEAPRYDAALLIYGDLCALAPAQRAQLLRAVHRALRPGGAFVLDVTTRAHRERHGLRNRWYAASAGFWKPGPHLVLEQGFDYPDELIYLDQYVVVEASGALSVYRNWFQDYTPERITAELAEHGLAVRSLWADLLGTPAGPASEWIGVVARKAAAS